ncbi:amino acid permease [Azorhizobium oxalatiphilum]|uniref:Amino acid permease n=1 Tax=Azorhizobium oxalatiphilum TaxID=980631 RepID=A0A917FBN7_9HYPH|nr:APC family permease [Azorhizobium oxalatiphilum]GGF65611.1 amino acid permease [Azorhizobium oxalatiphilum]
MSHKMQREIGVVGLTFVAVSGIIGSGWLFAPLMAAQHAGPASLIAWVIGGIAMLLLALTFAEISAMLPVPGGIARVPLFSHGNLVAMAMGWSAWVGYNTTAPIEVEAMLRYLAPHMPWLHTTPGGGTLSASGMAVAIGLMALFTLINAFGVKFFAYVNSAITWAKIAIPLLVTGMLLVSRFETGNFTAGGGFAPTGLAGILGAISSGGIIFSYIGFRHAVDMAGEAKNPGFTVPAALLFSVVICFVIYGGLQFAFIGALSPSDLANGWPALALPGQLGPLGALASVLGLLWLVSLLNVGAVVGPFGGALVAVGSNARLAYALAENGLFPRLMVRLSNLGVPLAALVFNCVLSSVSFVLLPFGELVQLNSSAIVLSFIVGPIAVVALRALLPGAKRPLRLPAVNVIAAAAFIISTLVVYWSGWSTVWRLGVCLGVGLALFLVYARPRMREAPDTREALWLVPYCLGTALLSYLGTFGGIGLLPFGWDMVAVALFALRIFFWAIGSRLPPDKFAARLEEAREHLTEETGHPVTGAAPVPAGQ